MTPPKVNTARRPPTRWMDRQDVASYLRCSPNSVDKLVREKVLTKYRIRGLHGALFDRAEVDACVVEAGREATPEARASATQPPGAAVSTDKRTPEVSA